MSGVGGRSIALMLAGLAGVLFVGAAHAGERIPRFSAPVVDEADAVPQGVQQSVDRALLDYQARTGNQLAVAVVRSTGNQSIEDYSIDLAREWGVGQKDKDNGAVLVIAMEDRALRIEVGRGLEGDLTDLESGRIIRERLVPLLRQGDVGAAVVQGTDAMRQALGDPQVGQLPPVPVARDPQPTGGGGALWLLLFAIPFVASGLFFGRGRRRRGRGWGMAGVPIIWGGGLGGGGFGGGGFGGRGGGGGGFGGGGGGGFGGGGASGSW